MFISYNLRFIATFIAMNFFITAGLFANWQKIDNKSSFQGKEEVKDYEAQGNKNDSMPPGVTKDWLSSLRDENGNRITSDSKTEASLENYEDPEGDAMQRKIINGFNIGEVFGYTVSKAGDVNGDGYDDIIVGSHLYSSAQGRAYIYFGGISMNSVADVILTGEASGNTFGISVSSAGDVNADEYSDVIVGAASYSANTGRVYIYFGGESMNNSADVILNGADVNHYFGISVSSAGDVNGDGYSDVIAGAYGYLTNRGRAYIFFGGASMNTAADVTMSGATSNNYFGYSVSTAGDVNGDGYSDVIVGAWGYTSNTGRAYVFFGEASMNNTADVTLTGEASSNYFGYSVTSAGDVNGDGYSDVIAGAYGYSSSTGRAYIYYGGASMNSTADVTMTGESSSSYFGSSVSSAGDVNGDGYSDVIAGADGYSSNAGRAYIFFGAESMNNTFDVTMTGEVINNYFGYSVSSAGDINGDGYSDVIAGAYGYSSNTGRVYLYDYFMKGEIIQDLTMTGEATNNSFGISVSSAGDVNGDGYSDVIVGAYGYNSYTGRAYIYLGGSTINNTAYIVMTGETAGDDFGKSVSSAGDVNGDGYADVIVGAEGYNSNTGRVYVYFGGVSMNSTADVIMTGGETGSLFGYSVSSAGDLNGDGYSDVIVGAPGHSTLTGIAYIYFGGASVNNSADVTMTGEAIYDEFGSSVSSAGDVNGDGYSDVILSAPHFASNTGRAYLFYGGASVNNQADVIMTGETTNNVFGCSVSSAGDVNRDGYSDVFVGAPGYASGTGRTYLFFGAESMNNTSDVTMTGEAAGNSFGNSVSSAGDVNGDGYSDVIAASHTYVSNTGKAYIYFGSSSMNNSANVTITGQAINNFFGTSLSSAGDINGDGYSDIIAGANGYNSITGRAYIYLGSAISVKPSIIYARDVTGDQGGYLNLKFMKSGFDVFNNGMGGINYQIERSSPPGINGYQWISVGTVIGTHSSSYIAEVHTPMDSGSSGNNSYFFRVTAVFSSTGDFWRSNIISGYSVDNLAPLPPGNLTGMIVMNYTQLNWNQSPENDLKRYIIYRNGTQIGTSETLNYNDNTILPDSNYTYRIAAEDIHGNISAQSNQVVISYIASTINIKAIPEGFYDASQNHTRMKDTVRVYLHNILSPYNVVDSSIAVMDSLTFQGSFRFSNAASGTYYIVLKHRNSIETWSNSGIVFVSETVMNYDFTNSASQAFGNNAIQVDASPIRFAVFSGDVNQDRVIDASDNLAIDNAASNFETGYLSEDLNGDEVVDASDAVIADNNAANFVSAVVP